MAENFRNARESKKNLLEDVQSEVNRLLKERPSARTTRQISDGRRFLQMVKYPPYSEAKTYGQLKKAIGKQRSNLQDALEDMKKYLPGHQISLFDDHREVPEYAEKCMQVAAEQLQEEIHWLHKCFGICSNVNYFK